MTLNWYGHVSMSSGLSKTILQGTGKGGRRRGGQGNRWEDNINEWTGLNLFFESLRTSKGRKEWREVIRRFVMAHLRPPEVVGFVYMYKNFYTLVFTRHIYIVVWFAFVLLLVPFHHTYMKIEL